MKLRSFAEAERSERENARTLKVFVPLADSADLE